MLDVSAPHRREVGSSGSRTAPVAIIGEAPGANEVSRGQPFVGAAGGVLDSCLHGAGIIRAEVYLTNLIKHKLDKDELSQYYVAPQRGRGWFTDAGLDWVVRLWTELASNGHSILVPLGKPAFSAFTGQDSITKYRGYIFEIPERVEWKRPDGYVSRDVPHRLVGMKVLPSIHPAATLHGSPWQWRYYLAGDLEKVRAHSSPGLVRPQRNLTIARTYEEMLQWLDHYSSVDSGNTPISVDIEVMNYCLSCFCISDSPQHSVTFPVYDTLTEFQECNVYRAFAAVLDTDRPKIFQNGMFDIHYLWSRYGIVTRGFTDPHSYYDTMLGHSVMYPDFLKSLAFLGSLYCGTQEYWKDMAKFKNVKEDS